ASRGRFATPTGLAVDGVAFRATGAGHDPPESANAEVFMSECRNLQTSNSTAPSWCARRGRYETGSATRMGSDSRLKQRANTVETVIGIVSAPQSLLHLGLPAH